VDFFLNFECDTGARLIHFWVEAHLMINDFDPSKENARRSQNERTQHAAVQRPLFLLSILMFASPATTTTTTTSTGGGRDGRGWSV
jgi:hypothetical protein